MNNAQPTPSSAAAPTHGAATSSLELCDARRARDGLATLLRAEQFAMADFLIALADFDRRRGWEPLGHANLFSFLVSELHLSRSSAFWRLSSARLILRHPEVIEPLRDGRLCLSTTAELAKVLTSENLEAVLPRYYRLSAREAAEVTVELQPRAQPPLRTVVTNLEMDRPAGDRVASLRLQAASVLELEPPARTEGLVLTSEPTQSPCGPLSGDEAPSASLLRMEAPRDDVEPLTADLRRLHITVSRQFLAELESARTGLSHTIPNATAEQVLQAALRLLLEKQAKARGQVKRPRAVASRAATRVETIRAVAAPGVEAPGEEAPGEAAPGEEAPGEEAPGEEAPGEEAERVKSSRRSSAPVHESLAPAPPPAPPLALALVPTEPPPARRTGPREAITAAVRRAVWERDGGRCCWPLDGGGVCGSTHQVELDHIEPWARFGGRMEENLRLTCHLHNALAARKVFGARWMERYQRGR